MSKILRKKVLPFAAAAALALAGGQAMALPFFPSSGTTPGTLFEDNDLDWFLDNDGDGLISEGDYLYAVAEFGTARDILPPIDPTVTLNTAADELVTLSRIKVDTITVTPIGGGLTSTVITFVPIDASTPMVSAYSLGSTIDLDLGTYANCDNMADCINAVTDGTLYAEFSMVDDDDQWFFAAVTTYDPLDPNEVAGLSQTTKVGSFNFALSQTGGPANLGLLELDCGVFTCAGDGLTNLRGSGDILGADGLPAGLGAFATSDTDISVIPEPGALALLGVGLLGMSAARRRRKGAKAA